MAAGGFVSGMRTGLAVGAAVAVLTGIAAHRWFETMPGASRSSTPRPAVARI